MSNVAAKLVAAYYDSEDIRYTILGDDDDVIRVNYKAESTERISTLSFFDDDCRTVGMKVFDYCKFPESKIDSMYKVCSRMNKKYRWVKFYVDEEDSSITISSDAIIEFSTCGREVEEVLDRMVKIADEAYPVFMREIWS